MKRKPVNNYFKLKVNMFIENLRDSIGNQAVKKPLKVTVGIHFPLI